jgi:hypothetical protein
MADFLYIYATTAGVFVVLTAILFVSRARRYSKGFNPSPSSEGSGTST